MESSSLTSIRVMTRFSGSIFGGGGLKSELECKFFFEELLSVVVCLEAQG